MKRQGLTVVEVLVALVILAVLGAVLSTALVSTMRHDQASGQRTQAAQYLNYFGRLVVGADQDVIPDLGETLSWDYGELRGAFADLDADNDLEGFAQPELYRVDIQSLGRVAIASVQPVHYRISVCWQAAEAERCVSANTYGGAPVASGEDTPAPPLTGIN